MITPTEIIVIAAEGLEIIRGDKRLFRGMSWELPRGKFMAVTGPSGIGKSSLLACLGGRLQPDAGSFRLSTNDPTQVGVVFQNLRLTRNLTVLTNVLCGRLGSQPWWRTLFSFPNEERLRAFEVMSELEIGELANNPVRKISGGEQQRAAMARVLYQSPEIILADEPTSNLDAEFSERVLRILRRQCDTAGKTAVCVLHDADLVERFADVELILGRGDDRGWQLRQVR